VARFYQKYFIHHKRMNEDDRNNNETVLPLLYRPMRTRRSSYPKYIFIRNGRAPILVRRAVLGNEISSALVNSERAWELPPIVEDIADALCWLRESDSPIHLRCIYNTVAENLSRVCPWSHNHMHPYSAHFNLAVFAGCDIARVFLHGRNLPYNNAVYPAILDYVGNRWGEREIIRIDFKIVLIDLYENMQVLFVSIHVVTFFSCSKLFT
jgi:hypothetical protein